MTVTFSQFDYSHVTRIGLLGSQLMVLFSKYKHTYIEKRLCGLVLKREKKREDNLTFPGVDNRTKK